jgi:hypothetical protein
MSLRAPRGFAQPPDCPASTACPICVAPSPRRDGAELPQIAAVAPYGADFISIEATPALGRPGEARTLAGPAGSS